jgi:hypothetical protein
MRVLFAVTVIAAAAFLIDREFNNGHFWGALSSVLRHIDQSFRHR